MIDSTIMKSIDPAKWHLATLIETALGSMGATDESVSPATDALFSMIEQPKDVTHGDLSLPCFRFAKPLKMKPADIATTLKEKIEKLASDWIESVDVIQAFLNFTLKTEKITSACLPDIMEGSFFTKLAEVGKRSSEKVMIEFSQPNTHKEFHVGHARNVCLGDCLTRLTKFLGYETLGVNYIGDEGTHVAKALWQIAKNYDEKPTDNLPTWYAHCYATASRALKSLEGDELSSAKEEISEILGQLESKEGKYYDLWILTKEHCMQAFYKIYEWLDVHFDHYFYESEVSEESQSIVKEYIEKGLFTESDGAFGIDMKEYKLGYFMARKSDGNTLYITKDLALARKKFRDFDVNRSIYVVGDEQIFHFKQLFKCLEMMGFEQAKDCYHLSYGMVVRKDGKMSSRDGNTFTFDQLRSLIEGELKKYLAKYENEWTKEKIADTAAKLTIGAIKYGMLEADPNREIVFDEKEWVSFEGHTGPYQMYSYARAKSILEKVKREEVEKGLHHLSCLVEPAEKRLAMEIYQFQNQILQSYKSLRPSTVANYLYELSKAFNKFYASSPIIKLQDENLKSARLALIDGFAKVSNQTHQLLGITPVEKM